MVAAAGLRALLTGDTDLFGALALLYCVGTPFEYGLCCSQASDLFKLAIRKPERADTAP